jgi:hypothetical protein
VIAALEAAESQETGNEIEVWAENWDIVAAFASVMTQWRVVMPPKGQPLYLGLDYTAARISLGAARVRVTPELWAGLQVMERAASAAMNERG